jgi:hypothetical protein
MYLDTFCGCAPETKINIGKWVLKTLLGRYVEMHDKLSKSTSPEVPVPPIGDGNANPHVPTHSNTQQSQQNQHGSQKTETSQDCSHESTNQDTGQRRDNSTDRPPPLQRVESSSSFMDKLREGIKMLSPVAIDSPSPLSPSNKSMSLKSPVGGQETPVLQSCLV